MWGLYLKNLGGDRVLVIIKKNSDEINDEKLAVHMYTTMYKNDLSQKLIPIFIFCKKELVVHKLSFQIKSSVNFCQKILEPPLYP